VSAVEANRDVWDIGIDLLLALGEDWKRFLELPYREKLNGDAVGESQRISRNSHIRLLRWLLRGLMGMLLLEEENHASHSQLRIVLLVEPAPELASVYSLEMLLKLTQHSSLIVFVNERLDDTITWIIRFLHEMEEQLIVLWSAVDGSVLFGKLQVLIYVIKCAGCSLFAQFLVPSIWTFW
jgi:hypothetical protein